jgi:hypothetical protein
MSLMEGAANEMTDFQFRAIIRMVVEILRGSSNLDEAIKKLNDLTKKDAEE